MTQPTLVLVGFEKALSSAHLTAVRQQYFPDTPPPADQALPERLSPTLVDQDHRSHVNRPSNEVLADEDDASVDSRPDEVRVEASHEHPGAANDTNVAPSTHATDATVLNQRLPLNVRLIALPTTPSIYHLGVNVTHLSAGELAEDLPEAIDLLNVHRAALESVFGDLGRIETLRFPQG